MPATAIFSLVLLVISKTFTIGVKAISRMNDLILGEVISGTRAY